MEPEKGRTPDAVKEKVPKESDLSRIVIEGGKCSKIFKHEGYSKSWRTLIETRKRGLQGAESGPDSKNNYEAAINFCNGLLSSREEVDDTENTISVIFENAPELKDEYFLNLIENFAGTPLGEFAAQVLAWRVAEGLNGQKVQNVVAKPLALTFSITNEETPGWRMEMETAEGECLGPLANGNSLLDGGDKLVEDGFRKNFLESLAQAFAVLEALREEHSIIHRDLGPHNLVVSEDGRVRIIDFGLARLVEQEEELAVYQHNVYGAISFTRVLLSNYNPFNAPPELRGGHGLDIGEQIKYVDIWGMFNCLLVSLSGRGRRGKPFEQHYLADLGNLLVFMSNNFSAYWNQKNQEDQENSELVTEEFNRGVEKLGQIFARALNQDPEKRINLTQSKGAFEAALNLVKALLSGKDIENAITAIKDDYLEKDHGTPQSTGLGWEALSPSPSGGGGNEMGETPVIE